MVVAKESDVTKRTIQTDGEQIQGNKTRNLRDRGPRIGEKGEGWASWTGQALFAWTRTYDEPRRSGKCGYKAAGVLAALTFPIRALRACAVLDCWRHGIAWQRSPVRCLLPCICAWREKETFQLFNFVQSLKIAHFRAYRDPYNTSAPCSIGEMQMVNGPRKEGPLKNVVPLSHDGKSIVRGEFERYCRKAREADKASSKELLM